MNILLTNDDGVAAPGLQAAYDAVKGLGTVYIVAPRVECSACSHRITLRKPVVIERRTEEHYGTIYAAEGTPADCVRVACGGLIEASIDLVVAGVNRGANAGVDVFYSGTAAAAREAAILGIRSIAVSQAVREGIDLDWRATSDITGTIVRELLGETLSAPGFWSVNYPAPIPPDARERIHRVPVELAPTPMIFERADRQDGRVTEFSNGAPYWDRRTSALSDYTVIRDGGIAITTIPLAGRF